MTATVNAAFAALVALAPPPKGAPAAARTHLEWARIQRRIGTRLPSDYTRFIDLYGSVVIGDFLHVFNPFTDNANVNLVERIGPLLSACRELKAAHPEEWPHPLFFEPGGMLPFGATDNGDVLYWLTHGDPDAWTVLVGESRGPRFEKFDGKMVEFVVALLEGKLEGEIFPTGLRGIKHVSLSPPGT